MDRRILGRAARLAEDGTPFVLATVTWRDGPTSAAPGATAIVLADGSMHGWLGGACAQPTVVREALAALRDGAPRRLALGVDAHRAGPDVTVEPMACASDGACEVYMEPILPRPLLVVIGRSPAVATLVSLAARLDWRTAVVDDGGTVGDHPDADVVVTDLDLDDLPVDEHAFVVVATQGHHDEPALQRSLRTPAAYVGLVASSKRASEVAEWLRSRGVSDADLARVRAPAGLDLGRVAHTEIAVAILAELVELRARLGDARELDVAPPATATDPVCGMDVAVDSAHYTAEHDGVTYYFCAAGCQRTFEQRPEDHAPDGRHAVGRGEGIRLGVDPS